MNPIELLKARREHVKRLSNQKGALGERAALAAMDDWLPRPRGPGMKNLLRVLEEAGTPIKSKSFDAIALEASERLRFDDLESIRSLLPSMIFVEIKTADQARVGKGFTGYFFALTENEIEAADRLGARHRVVLFNKRTDEMLVTSVPEILARARSMTWQVSLQL
jgi:hypothetical protein